VVIAAVDGIKETAEAFIVPPVIRDNIDAKDIIDDNDTNVVFIRSE
jgi:hypothetical protein